MSTLFKNKLLAGLVILLLVANITTIVVFWMGMKKMHPVAAFQQPSAFLIDQLAFNHQQQGQYNILIKDHRAQTQIIREQLRDAKDSFFNLLSHVDSDDNQRNTIATKISTLNRELDDITFDHFKEVRKICTTDQQQKFDKVIKEVLRMMTGPGPQGNRPPGKPGRHEEPQEGPPPPGE